MYIIHKLEDHEDWKQYQKKGFKKKRETKKQSNNQQQDQKLELSDTIKAALTIGDLSALITFLQSQSKE